MLALYSVALVVGQAPVLMRNRASQSAVPALCLPANWGHMGMGAGPLSIEGSSPGGGVTRRSTPGQLCGVALLTRWTCPHLDGRLPYRGRPRQLS